ncbi:MAG: type II secretion system F family protein [Pseudomonadota bacterium]
MKHFRYKVINENGRYVNGRMSAENPSDLATILRSTGLELVSFKEEKQKTYGFFNKIKTRDLIAVFIHLEQLERAGVSIIDSINDLKETADSERIKNLMAEIYEAIKNGSLFSESLSKHPDVFNPIHVGLISMGEKTGNLATSFGSIIEDLKWNMDIKRKTKKATTGPLFGIFMMCVVLGIMTTVVVPKVTGFIIAQGLTLPIMTVALIGFSDFVKNNWYFIIFSVPLIMVAMKLLAKNPEMAVKIDDFKLKLPILGPIISKIDAAKFCQFFAMTFKSGLGVIECLEASSSVIKNKAMKKSIIVVKQQVSDGQSLAKAIALTGYFPNLVVRMFKIGEESGNMETALQNIKFFYDREINDSIDKLVGMIQPTLTIVMGGMIAWITIAVFGPIYGSFSKLK